MDFLDTALCLHEKPSIQKFQLSWDSLLDESRVNRWVSVVIKGKVKELFLSVESQSQTSFIFPLSLFTCNSLIVLDLHGLRLNIPNIVSFPGLKLLRLRFMQFEDAISLNKLFSNCPILEELSLTCCRGLKSEVLCIANLSLKNLYISCCCFEESTVNICSPNLSTISYGHVVPADFLIDRFSSLAEADIDILHCVQTLVLIKLFEKLSNVKLLKMSGQSFRSICIPGEEDDGWSLDPTYSLPHLKSINFEDVNRGWMELNGIKLFLKYAGSIETVTVRASPSFSKDDQLHVAKQLLMFPKPANCHLSITGCLLSESAVKISAPNLLTINYTRYPPKDFVLNSFPSLVKADVGFDVYKGYKYQNKVFVKLWAKLSSAKLLKIYANSFLILREADILLTNFPAFNNLIHLEIGSQYGCTSFGTDTISTVRTFFKFLQLSPNLESIIFPQAKDNDWSLDHNCWPPNLKSIKFKNIDGKPMELNAISFFLKYGGSLEKVTIVASQKLSEDHEKQLTVTKLLLMFQRPANCVVKFLTNSEDT
ncbi:hypothetical protein MKW92_040936 [Papaver armeniacum]|nr:hypothetical protein MKW92_040936 [Papaver armeniacum]